MSNNIWTRYLKVLYIPPNQLVRKAHHPNLFETIVLIKNEQASTEVQMIQVAARGQPKTQEKKSC